MRSILLFAGSALLFAKPLTAQTPLSIQRLNDQVILRWPVSAIPFRVQANESLNDATAWASLAKNPTVVGNSNVVALSECAPA